MEELQLLFFDTFSHENTEELNLDLVQFPSPVLVHEIRVIPLGTKIQVNVPGGYRMGATNPSEFRLELFVNNLTRPNSSVFEKLGILEYSDKKDIIFKPGADIPTDGLILKGWYSTVTLAVYGSLTTVSQDHASPPPPPPPAPSQPRHADKRSNEYPGASHVAPHQPSSQAQISPVPAPNTMVPEPHPGAIPERGLQPPHGHDPHVGGLHPEANRTQMLPENTHAGHPPGSHIPGGHPPGMIPLDRIPMEWDNTQGGFLPPAYPPPSGHMGVPPQAPPGQHMAPPQHLGVPQDGYRDVDDRSALLAQQAPPQPQGEIYDDRYGYHHRGSRDQSREGSPRDFRDYRDERPPRDRSYNDSYDKRDYDSRGRRQTRSRSPGRRPASPQRSMSPSRRHDSPSSLRSPGRRSRSPGRRSRSPGRRSRSPGRRSRSPGRRSRSPGRRSRSPGRRSRSPGRRSRSPGRRSRSPGGKLRSPVARSRSPGRRSRSPARRSHTPGRRSRSPGGRSRSPGRRSRTPSGRSRSPGRRSRSPGRRSRSPNRRSPIRRSRSPGRRSRSPARRSRSPRRRSRTPEGRSRSPRRSRSPGRRSRSPRRPGSPPSSRSPRRPGSPPKSRSPSLRSRSPRRSPSGRSWSPRSGAPRSWSPGQQRMWSPGRPRSRSPGRPRSRSPGSYRSRSPGSYRSRSPGASRPRSPGRQRSRSPGSHRSRSPGQMRQRSPGLPRSRSPGPPRTRSPGPPRSRSPGLSRSRSPGPLRSRSPGSQKSRSPGPPRSRSPGPPRSRSPGLLRPRSPGPPRPIPQGPPRSRSPVMPRQWSPGPRGRSPGPQRVRSPGRPRSRSPGPPRPRSPNMMRPRSPPMMMGQRPRTPPRIESFPIPTHYDHMQGMSNLPPPMPPMGDDMMFGEPPGPDMMYNLSDGEIDDQDGYEEISSDEDMFGQDMGPEGNEQIDFDVDDGTYGTAFSTYNPYQFEVVPLTTFSDPSLTTYETELTQVIENKLLPEPAQKILDVIERFKTEEHHDSWVETLEEFAVLIPQGLPHIVTSHPEAADTLVDWALEGLDLEKAMLQPSTPFKVRHLKMGVNLTGALAVCDTSVALRLLNKGVQHKLIDLYQSQYMSVSVKLHIIRSLDQTTHFHEGLRAFLERDQAHMTGVSGYQRLLEIMLSKQDFRTMVAMSALIQKMHIYEVSTKFRSAAQQVAETTKIQDNRPEQKEDFADDETKDNTDQMNDVDMEEPEIDGTTIVESEAEAIISYLEDIYNTLCNAKDTIAQPKRTLPLKTLFLVSQQPFDPLPGLYHMLYSTKFLESLFLLLASPSTAGHPGIFTAIRDVINQLLLTQSGLLFLSSRPDVTNGIVRVLTHTSDYSREEGEENPAQQLGLQMVHYLQILQFVDQLKECHKKVQPLNTVDDADALGILHSLYTMTFNHLGKEAAVKVLGLEENLESILPFLELAGMEESKKRWSVCPSYAALTLLLVVRNSDNVVMLEKFHPRLSAISSLELTSKLAELPDWLYPIKNFTKFDYDCLPALIKKMKLYNDEITSLPRGLITLLRIFQHLAIAPQKNKVQGGKDELKYKYALVELFSADCLPFFINVLQRLSESHIRGWQQGVPLSQLQATLFIATVKPALALTKAILSYLIMARGSEFQDLTSLPALFNLHTVACSVPLSGISPDDIQSIQNDIIDLLMAFTQPALKAEETEEALSNSLWTMTMAEVMKYTLTAPYTFLSGCMMITELLPLSLPIQTKEPLDDEEVNIGLNMRKLWSAHLHPLIPNIQDIIRTLAAASCHQLQYVLRRVCWQIADLGLSSAQVVVRCMLDLLLETLAESKENLYPPPPENPLPAGIENPLPVPERPPLDTIPDTEAPGQTARVLCLISYSMNQPPIKIPILSLMKSTVKGEEKYSTLLGKLLNILNIYSEKPTHVQAQECIVSILQSMCDPDVSLVTAYSGRSLQEQLSNALPTPDQLSLIVQALVDHIGHRDHSYASILPALRTMVVLTFHDFGFYFIRSTLEKNYLACYNLFTRINNQFSKDSSDCLSTLSTAIEFLRMLVQLDQPDDEGNSLRTYAITEYELRHVLNWKGDFQPHPLDELEGLLTEFSKDEETLESLLESISELVHTLKHAKHTGRTELTPIKLPEPEVLTNQFKLRTEYVLEEVEDDRTTPQMLGNIVAEENDQDVDLIRCDLQEMAIKYCPEFDLKAELEKGTITGDITVKIKKKRKYGPGRESLIIGRNRGGRFIAPMRGRGFGRGSTYNRGDAFRSRAPNTSRPPSMHVDDFQQAQADETNNTERTPQPARRPERDFNDRGRGSNFDRGGRGNFSNRGRFFSPPGNYGRNRDDNNTRGGFRGGGNNSSRGGGGGGFSNRGSSRGGGTFSDRGRGFSSRGGSGFSNSSRGGSSSGGLNSSRGSPWRSNSKTSFTPSPTRGGFSHSNTSYNNTRDNNRGGRSSFGDNRRQSFGDNRRDTGGLQSPPGGGSGGGRGGGGRGRGGSHWMGKDPDQRFMPPPSRGGFRGGGGGRGDGGRKDYRHERSYTR